MKMKTFTSLVALCALIVVCLGVGKAHATMMDLWGAGLAYGTDVDGDGYYEDFTIEIDADMIDGSTGSAYAVITDNTGDAGFGPWTITGTLTSDNYFATMDGDWYSLSAPATVAVNVYVYDYSTGEYAGGVTLNIPIDDNGGGGTGDPCASAYPFLWGAGLAGGVDADGDGYYEEFTVEIDGDSSSGSCSHQVYAEITDNTGNVYPGPWTITGSLTSDNAQVTMYDEYYALSSPQNVTVTVTLYDYATGASVGSDSFNVPVDNGSTGGGSDPCATSYPFFYDVSLYAGTDADGDGYYEDFTLAVDADSSGSSCSHEISVVVSDNTGGMSFGPQTISGWTGNDTFGATMYDDWYALSSPAVQSVTVDLYDITAGAYVDSVTLSIPVDDNGAGGNPCASAYSFLWGAGLDGGVDADGDGYYEEFTVWIDGDTTSSSCPAQVYAEVTDNTGNLYPGPWSVAGEVGSDTVTVTMYDEYYVLSSPQNVTVTVTLYDYATGAAIGSDSFSVPVDGGNGGGSGTPFVYDLWLNDYIDADSDGYYEEFQFGIDVDCANESCSAGVYSVVSADLGDVSFGPWTVTGWAAEDAVGLTMSQDDYGLSAPATVNVTVTTYDNATGAAIDQSTFAIPIDGGEISCSMNLYDAWLLSGVDADGDGYYEEFTVEIDADMSESACTGNAFAVITDNTGNAGFGPWGISGFATSDNYQATMYDEWYDLSSPGVVNVSVYVYDYDSESEAGYVTFAVPVDDGTVGPPSWPLSDSEFVQQVYRDFLNREADQSGLDYWVGQLGAGLSRSQLVELYLLSAEFQGNVAPVARLYFAYFNRIPDYEGLMYWVGQFGQGTSLGAISAAFAGSAEFQATYGSLSNQAFVGLVYQNVLGRAADAGGLSYWSGMLNSGAMSRGEVMVGFSESVEYQAQMDSAIYVTMTYIGLLRRAPDQGGFDYWVAQLNGGTPGLGLIDGFLGSAEYQARFP